MIIMQVKFITSVICATLPGALLPTSFCPHHRAQLEAQSRPILNRSYLRNMAFLLVVEVSTVPAILVRLVI